jgi:ubiquinone/menaquinone biosynthesis C-methylase UbiE
MKAALDEYFYPVRERVLESAKLADHQLLIDVGCGDGLIAFRALEKSTTSTVIFSDVSQTLLNHTRSVAQKLSVVDRCRFLVASAEGLPIQSGSVDVVTACCVLIHVEDKQSEFNEFFRILKPGGRMSVFEPINRMALLEPERLFSGFDVTPIIVLAAKVKAIYFRNQSPETDPMLNFDERDLFDFAQKSGFDTLQLEFQIKQEQKKVSDWETQVRRRPNPRAPSLEEAMEQALTSQERELFVRHLRPLVESRQGRNKSGVAYLSAIK